MTAFGPVAPHYDHLMRSVPYRMWVGYYLLLLGIQDARPERILDVCCGTGSMCELLHKEGFEVAGFDVSAPMIKRAKEKARRKKFPIEYFVADASSFELNRTYDAAFSFFDSLNNITEPRALGAAFKCIANHLPERGSLIFDLNTAYAFEARLFDQQNLGESARLRYKWTGEWDRESKLIDVDMVFWHNGEEFHEVHHQRAYSDEEIRALLKSAGFNRIRSFKSYTLEKPGPTTDRVHYSALKV